MDIYLYNEIVPGQEEKIARQIKEAKGDVYVHISSPGGEVYSGWTISNLLKSCKQNTVALIEGYCASIATYIALSCDKVLIAPTAQFMIHYASVGLYGDKIKLLKEAQTLEKIDEELEALYMKRSSLDASKIKQYMNDEYVMSAKEAVDFGFADAYMEPLKAVAKIEIRNNTMENEKVTEKLNLIEKMIKAISPKKASSEGIKNMTYELEEGGSVYVESEDESLVGNNVFLTNEEGEPTEQPAPDGNHTLASGVVITVEGGVITSETPAETEAKDKEKEEMKKEIESLKAEINSLKEEKTNISQEKEEAEANTQEQIQALATQISELKSIAVGQEFKQEKPHVQPSNKGKTGEETNSNDGLSGLLNKLKRQYNG